MYKVSDKINGSSFRIMEAMYCPEDYHKVVSELSLEETISIATFKAAVYRVLSARWLQWCICHPEVGDERVHPSRSMLPFCPASGWCLLNFILCKAHSVAFDFIKKCVKETMSSQEQ